MMNKRERNVRVRLSVTEYRQLVAMADRAGITQSEFVRFLIAQERDASRFEEVIDEVKRMVDLVSEGNGIDLLVIEVLWLVRELVADRNAQLLARVNFQLDQFFGKERKKL